VLSSRRERLRLVLTVQAERIADRASDRAPIRRTNRDAAAKGICSVAASLRHIAVCSGQTAGRPLDFGEAIVLERAVVSKGSCTTEVDEP